MLQASAVALDADPKAVIVVDFTRHVRPAGPPGRQAQATGIRIARLGRPVGSRLNGYVRDERWTITRLTTRAPGRIMRTVGRCYGSGPGFLLPVAAVAGRARWGNPSGYDPIRPESRVPDPIRPGREVGRGNASRDSFLPWLECMRHTVCRIERAGPVLLESCVRLRLSGMSWPGGLSRDSLATLPRLLSWE